MTNSEQKKKVMEDEAVEAFIERLAEFIVEENLIQKLLDGENDITSKKED